MERGYQPQLLKFFPDYRLEDIKVYAQSSLYNRTRAEEHIISAEIAVTHLRFW